MTDTPNMKVTEEMYAAVCETIFGPQWRHRAPPPIEGTLRTVNANYQAALHAQPQAERGRDDAELLEVLAQEYEKAGGSKKIADGFRAGQNYGVSANILLAAMRRVSRPAPSAPAQGDVVMVRHKKRGTVYSVIGRAKLQASDVGGFSDYQPMVVYKGEDGQLWVRPADEFDDGRFEPFAASPPEATPAEAVGEKP